MKSLIDHIFIDLTRTLVFTAIVCSLILLITLWASADGSIGFSYSQVLDDRSTGITAGYEGQTPLFDYEIDAQLQSGDIHRAKLHAELVFSLGVVGLKPSADTTGKGYELNKMGSDTNYGLALTVPVGNMTFDVGIGGKSSNPWSAPNAYADLVSQGYDEDTIKGLGLSNIHPTPKGIPFRDGNFLNTFVTTGFKKGRVDIDLKGIIELAGDGERAHQIHSRFETSREIFRNVDLTTGLELAFQFYESEIHYDSAFFTNFGYRW